MLDKRTSRSQNYKQFQLQQQQKLVLPCDVLPQSKFDFSLADPAFGNIYELLKVTQLYLSATHSPVSSTVTNIMFQFEQLAACTTSTVAKYAVQTIKPTMIDKIPSPLQSPECKIYPISISSTDGIFGSIDTIFSLLEKYTDQLEANCNLLEQNLQLSSKVHELTANISVCERHNLLLDEDASRLADETSILASDISRLQAEVDQLRAENEQLRLKSKPTLKQQRAMLVYAAAVAQFQTPWYTFESPYYAYSRFTSPPSPAEIWTDRYPGVPPPSATTGDYG